MDKKLYNAVINGISKGLNEAIEDIEFNGKHLVYNPNTKKYDQIINIKTGNNSIILNDTNDQDVSVRWQNKQISTDVNIQKTYRIWQKIRGYHSQHYDYREYNANSFDISDIILKGVKKLEEINGECVDEVIYITVPDKNAHWPMWKYQLDGHKAIASFTGIPMKGYYDFDGIDDPNNWEIFNE